MSFKNSRYKLSRYNLFHEVGNIQYVWNTYSNALMELDKSGQEYVASFRGVDDESDEFNILKTQGIIVHERLDELGRVNIEEKFAKTLGHENTVTVTIAPGLDCNYNCRLYFACLPVRRGNEG